MAGAEGSLPQVRWPGCTKEQGVERGGCAQRVGGKLAEGKGVLSSRGGTTGSKSAELVLEPLMAPYIHMQTGKGRVGQTELGAERETAGDIQGILDGAEVLKPGVVVRKVSS